MLCPTKFVCREISLVLAKMKSCCNPLSFPKTIIFCRQKRTVCDVYDHITRSLKCKSLVTVYHASLSAETKEHVYHSFCGERSQLRCLVSTVAFGMVRRMCKCVHYLLSYPR